MKYCGANEKWSPPNVVRFPTGLFHYTTTAGTSPYEKSGPELGQSEDALAPINQLPDDVLCYIFTLHCREMTDTVRLPFNHSNVSPQIAISHVCSVWRHVILNMPLLWSDFEIFMDDAKDGDMVMKLVHDWLFRARSLPCSLALTFNADDSTLDALRQEHWFTSIVERLISQFRFRKLRTPWSSSHWVQFLQLPAESLSCVEDLHICCINPPSPSNFGVLLDSFKKLSKLTSLRLDQSVRRAFHDVVYSEDSVFVRIPWHQIRHIHLNIPTSVLFCFTILQCSSMVLETCSLVVKDCYRPWAEIHSLYPEPLYCPQLRTLELEVERLPRPGQYHYPAILDQFLPWIRMPNLKTLSMTAKPIHEVIISFSTLVKMQHLSNMQLTEFIYNGYLDVGKLLTTFPSLKGVTLLGDTFLDDDTISQLGSGFIAPCLEEFIINCHFLNLGKLLRMVKARSSLGKPVNRDERQVENEPTSFRYVVLWRPQWEVIKPEYTEIIEEIKRYDVELIVCRNKSWPRSQDDFVQYYD